LVPFFRTLPQQFYTLEFQNSDVENRIMQEWSEIEEKHFEQIMLAGHLDRMEASRLYRRNKSDIGKALAIALREAPSAAELAKRAALSIAAKKRWVKSSGAGNTQTADENRSASL
jgi:hypothetical protein